jgi:hypothetical protein
VGHWSARAPLYAAAAFCGAVWILILIGVMVDATGSPLWLGVAALLLIAGAGAAALRAASRSDVALTASAVLIGPRRRPRHRIELTRLGGVAVVRALPGWAIFLWSDDDEPVRLGAPERVFALRSQSTADADAAYWNHIAGSPCGQAAALIHRYAAKAHAGTGPLARSSIRSLIQRDRHLFADPAPRWWSPDGEHS